MRCVRFERRSVPAWGALLLLCLIGASTGCAVFNGIARLPDARDENTSKSMLPPIPRSMDAIQLDIFFIERPAGDPLLGAPLWGEVDEIGPGTAETRMMLAKNGLRVGQVGSSPPRALETLFRLAQEVQSGKVGNSSRAYSHHRIVLPSGGETQIEVMPAVESFAPTLYTDTGSERREYTNARGILRMWAHREQDGWTRLEFQPEVNYGRRLLRQVPDEDEKSLQLRQTQQLDALYTQRFDVTLNVGEMAVISANDQADNTLGYGFFHQSADGSDSHKLLVIRLSDMGKVEPIYSERSGALHN